MGPKHGKQKTNEHIKESKTFNLNKTTNNNKESEKNAAAIMQTPGKFSFEENGDSRDVQQPLFVKVKKKEKENENENDSSSPQVTIVNSKSNQIFCIKKRIGSGFYSKVLLCFQGNKYYAIKTLKKRNIKNMKAVQHLTNEKIILEKIKNKFIINLIDSFEIEDKLFMVYPYYHIDLFTLISLGKLKETLCQLILAQIYLALVHLHQNSVLYRDLKPENVILDCEEGIVKLIDFGLAKEDVTYNSRLTEICGTNEYVPPEVIRGESYSFNFDWWTYGIFAYELLIGAPPFVGNSQADIFHKILSNPIQFPQEKIISDEAKDFIEYLLKKEKDERIRTENIPYHPFFKGLSFEKIINDKYNAPLKTFLANYKNVSRIVTDQPAKTKKIKKGADC